MGPLLLFITTFIWGTAFLAQKLGADTLGPFAMTCFRNILGGAFLLGCIAFRQRHFLTRRSGSLGGAEESQKNLHVSVSPRNSALKKSILAGICCGIPLFFAMLTQQIGVEKTTPGICAFLTTNYVLIVPVGAALLSRKLPPFYVWIGVALALLGTYFISINGETLSIGPGESWTLLCAVMFSIQMLVVDHFAKGCDVLVMSATQLLTCAVIGLPCLFLPSEAPKVSAFLGSLASHPLAILPVFYCGVFSSGIAYTLQNFGQAKTSAGLAAILMSMESVFGALSGYVALGDRLSPRQFAGCALVFAASALTSLFSSRKSNA